MNIDELIAKAMKSGKNTLNEHDSKHLLASYGIPVVQEEFAADESKAVAAAERCGFPVVLKGVGASLTHKTERGLVHLNISRERDLRQAARAIEKEAGDQLEGLLVQPQLRGKREFLAGLFRDREYGPVVMFGVGGILTEALSDISLRVAPVTEIDAADMLDEIRTHSMLKEFRGEKAADRHALIKTIMALSRIGMERPEIAEIDLNPLIISPDGDVCAVDALVVVSTSEEKEDLLPAIDPFAIRNLFYPRSVAFIGASNQMGKWGHMLLSNTISGRYEGDIYMVNPKGGTIAGYEVYTSIADIPGKVDLGVVTIAASQVMDLIPQFKKKGIKNMLLITSGFGETGPEGKALEKELVQTARDAGIMVLGPNTMGICNPHNNFYCTGTAVKPKPGSTAVVAQSGNLGVQLLAFAEEQGIGIRGFCGSGNEAMITVEDFIDGFEVDELTDIVMLYVESVKNGRRFFESARRLGKKKPIILLKGGQTAAGNRAAASHTGALSSDSRIFDAVCTQAGVIKVQQSMELLDLAAAFSSLPLPRGKRVAIMTLGGGWGVITADMCSKAGLEIPELPPEILEEFDKILPPYWSRSNPADIVGETDNSLPLAIMEGLLKWDGCDGVINLGILGRRIFVKHLADSVRYADPSYSPQFLSSVMDILDEYEKQYVRFVAEMMETYGKPIYGVSLLTDEQDQTVFNVEGTKYKSVFYPTPERAVHAFSAMYEYYNFIHR